jgi:hypothetical protein
MRNPLVFWLSILGLGFIVLAILISPWFVAGAVIIMLINQRELIRMRNLFKK